MGYRDFGTRFKQAVGKLLSPQPARPAVPLNPASPIVRRAVIQEVEARLLYSADIAPGLLETDSAEVRIVDNHAAATADTTQQQNRIAEIVFVDTSVENWQQLLGNLQETRPDIEVVTLNPGEDGIARVSAALQGRTDLSALHFITHGTAGALQLGSTRLDAASLQARSAEISGWSNALNSEADILLYGCNLTANDAGVALADQLAALTGADIAASDDLTGNATQGGDWTLEYRHGAIETAVVVDAATQQNWNGTLAIVQDAVSSAATSTLGSTSLSFAHTVGSGSNGILIVEVSLRYNAGASSVTYGGVALTKLSSVTDALGVVTAELWYLKSPTAGTANVVVTLPTTHEFVAGASSFFNVNQTTTFGTVATADGSSGTASLAVSSATGELVIDVVASRQNTTSTVGAGQTQLWSLRNGTASADAWGGSSTEAGAASVTMSWTITSSEWAATGVSLKAAPNVAPVLTTTGTTLSYTENAAATAIDTGLTVTDADNTTLSSATIQISGNYSSAQDVLAFTNQNGITGSWNSGTGTLTLSGSATVANYQTALRSVTYQNTSDNPSTSTRTVTFTVSDGTATDTATRNISVAAVNDAPVVTTTGTTLSYTENAAATVIDSALTITDADTTNMTGATITISSNYSSSQDVLAFTNQLGITGSWNATTGVLTLSGTTTVANYQTALRSITYQNTSDNPSTSTRTVTFTVNDGSTTGSNTRNI
ncbi:DUF4347 domain-containing protein, partial [Viridibacterium curvum]|uniref:DUF4347 domain-containing protein n=1 Tax=Viridibacterium curvum TaxID=1101404 RepID=UPI0031E91F5C